jgi:transcriptional regulator of heat shock response
MSITGIASSVLNQNSLDAASKLFQQDFKQIGQDLKSGSLSSAKQDFATLQNDLLTKTASSLHQIHNNHILSTGAANLTDQNSQSLVQDLTQLGQSLSSGNLSAAQQAYAALQTQSSAQTTTTGIGGHYTEPPVYHPPVTTLGIRNNMEPPVAGNPISMMA